MAAAGEGCICVDGALLPPREATVSVLDAGFLLGDGLFESLRASGGVPYLLDRHLERLYAGAEEAGFAGMPERERLAELVKATLARADLDDAYLRVTVTRGLGGAPVSSSEPPTAPSNGSPTAPSNGSPTAPSSGCPTVVIAALPAPARTDPAEGIAVALIGPPPQHGPKAKSTSRQAAVMAKRRAERAGALEGIYVSGRGRVLEGTSSNVFALCGRRLLTPPAEDCLPGITRSRVLELARAGGIDAVEAPLDVETLLGAEEAFVTNAVQGLRAIALVDGRPLPVERPVFARLAALYKADRMSEVDRVREVGRVRAAAADSPPYRATA